MPRTLVSEARMVFLRNEEDRPYALLGISRNITKRKQAEIALKESEERFRALIENASDAIAVMDGTSKVLYGSPAMGRILGLESQEVIGMSILDVIHPDDLEDALPVLKSLLAHPGSTVKVKYRFHHQDGSWRWIEGVEKNMLHDPKVKGIILNYRDVTERQQTEEALRESEEKYRTFLEKLPDMVYELRIFRPDVTSDEKKHIQHCVDQIQHGSGEELDSVVAEVGEQLIPYFDGTIIYANETSVAKLGYPLDKLSKINMAEIIATEQLELALKNTLKIFFQGSQSGLEYELITADGNRIFTIINAHLTEKEFPFIVQVSLLCQRI